MSDDWHVAVVWTHRGWASFPKGKRERGESNTQCAVRELEEEAGIRLAPDQLHHPDKMAVVETSPKTGDLNVAYFVALGVPRRALRADRDPDGDLARAAWVPLDDLPKQRWRADRTVAVATIHSYLQSRRKASEERRRVTDTAFRHGLVGYIYEAQSMLGGGMPRSYGLALALSEFEDVLRGATTACRSPEEAARVYGRLRAAQALERGGDAAVLPIEREIVHRIVVALGGA